MKIGIVGGALQGMEATYLSMKAGYQTVVLDKRRDAPALSLADEPHVIDVVKEKAKAKRVLEDCDAVIPANENQHALEALGQIFQAMDVPLMFDRKAYEISCSKVRSNQMMRDLNVSMPRDWPDCGFPVIVKPSGQSGSVGVSKAWNQEQFDLGVAQVRALHDDLVVQEFVSGPNISIEVIGDGQVMQPAVITEVILDDIYDCKMVRSPFDELDDATRTEFIESSRRMGEAIGLRGIMDVEAIVSNGVPKVLEIDARIPSQTPAALLGSSGINLMEMLVNVFVHGKNPAPKNKLKRAAFYEHLSAEGDVIRATGEGVFSEVEKPHFEKGLFGADEMITDYAPGKKYWKATMVCSGRNEAEARKKRMDVIERMMEENGIREYIDPSPGA